MPNPDLEITGGPGHPDPEITKGGGGGTVSKIVFSALRASVWSKNREGARAPTLDPPLSMIVLVNVND